MAESVGFCSDFAPRQKNRNGSRVLNTFRQKYVSRSSFEASESFTFLASRSGFTGVRQTCFKTRVGTTFAPLGRCARFLEDSSILRVFGAPWTTNCCVFVGFSSVFWLHLRGRGASEGTGYVFRSTILVFFVLRACAGSRRGAFPRVLQ